MSYDDEDYECRYRGIAGTGSGPIEGRNTNVRMFEVEHNGERIELHPVAVKELAKLTLAEIDEMLA